MKRLLAGLMVACLGLPAIATANPGYTVDDVTLRAGPSTDYPSITVLPEGISIEIYGCLDDWSWCDVSTEYDRGWVSGYYVESVYDNRRVIIADYGPRIGLPILSFALGAYWVDHYRNRSWYNHRDRWEHRRIPHRPASRPSWYRHDRPDYRPDRGHGSRGPRNAPGNPPIPINRGRDDRGHNNGNRGRDNRGSRTAPGNPPIPVDRSRNDRRGSNQNRGRGTPARQATPRQHAPGNPPIPVQRGQPRQPQQVQHRDQPAAAGHGQGNHGNRGKDDKDRNNKGKDDNKGKDRDRH